MEDNRRKMLKVQRYKFGVEKLKPSLRPGGALDRLKALSLELPSRFYATLAIILPTAPPRSMFVCVVLSNLRTFAIPPFVCVFIGA